MHISKLLNPLESIETRLSVLYEWFGKVFQDDPEASRLFGLASLEETVHANLVRYEKRLVVKNSDMFQDVEADMQEINNLLSRIELIQKSDPPSLEKAVETAMAIESSAVEQHYLTAIQQANPEVAKLLRSLATYDCRHAHVFGEFARQRGFALDIRPSVSSETCGLATPAEKEAPSRAIADKGGMDSLPKELAERLDTLYASHERMGYYKVLGIRDYASETQIKRAYYEMAKEFHPDRYPFVGEDVRNKLRVVFGVIHSAYATLIDPASRKEYDQTLSSRVHY